MRKILCVIFLSLFFSVLAGKCETDDPLYDLLTRNRQYECLDIISNARELIPDYFALGKKDSAIIIMQYVENKCGLEVFERLRLLLEIESGDISPIWCESDLVKEILDMQDLMWDQVIFQYHRDIEFEVNFEKNTEYKLFLEDMANNLAAETDSSSFGHALCKYLAGDRDYVLERLAANQFEGTCLQEKYDATMMQLEEDLKAFRGRWEIGSGIWRPTGENDVLGDKLEINGALGTKSAKFGMDVIGGIRVLDAEEEYIIIQNDQPKSTDYFFGGYIEMALNYDIINYSRFDLECFGGVGYDGFGAAPETDEHKSKAIGGWGFCLGIKPRFFYNRLKTRYLGFQFRYDFLNYKNEGGTDMPDNAISISLIWGYLGNSRYINRAKDLHYYDWKENH